MVDFAQVPSGFSGGRDDGLPLDLRAIADRRPQDLDRREICSVFLQHADDIALVRERPGQRVLWASPSLARQWAIPEPAPGHEGMDWNGVVAASDRERVRKLVATLVEGQAFDWEYGVRAADGTLRHCRERGRARTPAGADCIVSMCSDTTAAWRLQVERQRRLDCENEMARMLATASGAFFRYRRSADGRVEASFENPEVAAAYGLRQPGVDGLYDDVFDIAHEDDRERVRAAIEQSARTLVPVKEEFRVWHRKRGLLWTELHVLPLRDPDAGVSWLGFMQDITARKEAEQALVASHAALEQRVHERTLALEQRMRDMDSFTYTVSHDLRAPLRAIDGYSRLLAARQGEFHDECRLYLANIRTACDGMSRLIDDLLRYARVDKEHQTLAVLELRPLVDSVLGVLQFEITQRRFTVRVSVDGVHARADPVGLHMALRNLIENALKFGPQDGSGRIEISAQVDAGRCRLSVRDNGRGFHPRYREKVFDIFRRLEPRASESGSGIGLAIVRRAVEKMGGTVRADAAPAAGATFHIEIDAGEAVPPADATGAGPIPVRDDSVC